MTVRGVGFQNGGLILEGYPTGATVHAIESVHAMELRRIAVFISDIHRVENWLALLPSTPPSEDAVLHEALADAALLAFCRCFDKDHPLKPLKPELMFTEPQRVDQERLRKVRNKVVAHDDRLVSGVYSLIVQDAEKSAIEAVSITLHAPFVALAELDKLRELNAILLNWLVLEHERIASEIVKTHNAMPFAVRASAPVFSISVTEKDHFTPEPKKTAKV